jgi:hypothetical protein
VVQVTVAWARELKGAHADVVKCFIIDTEGLIGVLNELVDRKGSVIGLDDSVRDFGRGHNRKGSHHAVREFLADLIDKKGTYTGTRSTTEGVGNLKALEAVGTFSFAADNVEDLVNKLGTLSIVALSLVVSGARLTRYEVVGTEELTERASTDGVYGTGLQIDEDGTRDVLVARGLRWCRLSVCA